MEVTKGSMEALTNEWQTPPTDIAYEILSWLDVPALLSMCQLNKAWQALIKQDRFWKPIVLKHISLPKTVPESWYALFQSHRHGIKNLQNHQHLPLPYKQEQVDAILPYGDEPDKIPNHLLLLKEKGKKIERWNLEGESEVLLDEKIPFTSRYLTEVMWSNEGPELFLYNMVECEWRLLDLNGRTNIKSGKEKSFAPKDLSKEYLSAAKGNLVGIWKDLDTPPYMLPTPLWTKDETPYFILQNGSTLKVSTQSGDEKNLPLLDWQDIDQLSALRIQPTTNGPIYLAAMSSTNQTIILWNTETWTAEQSSLLKVDYVASRLYEASRKRVTPKIKDFKSKGHHYLLVSHVFKNWLVEFNPQDGTFIGKTHSVSIKRDNFIPFSMYQTSLILDVKDYTPRHGIDQVPGTLSIWHIDSDSQTTSPLTKTPNHIALPIPRLERAAICMNPQGELILVLQKQTTLETWEVKKNKNPNPHLLPSQNTFKISEAYSFIIRMGLLLLVTTLGGIIVYKASRSIWKASPFTKSN